MGFAHWISYPGCRPSPEAMGSAAPQLLAELGNDVLSRVITWRRAWGEQDPEAPHSHFGPFAVHPDAQGKRFGRRLMEHYCEVVDGAGEASYLETERPENLAFYRKAGFEVTAERDVLGLPSWFMTRAARGNAA
jgi:GNAT superfamily N-acetyltransferase